jgi:Cupin-like domain
MASGARSGQQWFGGSGAHRTTASRTQRRLVLAGRRADERVTRLPVSAVADDVAASELTPAAAGPVPNERKLGTLLEALGRQFRQSPAGGFIPALSDPTPEEFYSYYFSNRPLVLRGLTADWPAMGKWTPEYFAERFGDVIVEVMRGRESDPYFEANCDDHRTSLPMSSFVAEVRNAGRSNDVYLVAKNELLANPKFASLWDDFLSPCGILDERCQRGSTRLWLGPAGTTTPLHHDASNILFCQVYGRKLIKLIPPYYHEQLYNRDGCMSDVDLDDVDFRRFPLMRKVLVLEIELQPGEMLFMPLGWWHWVRALDVSISLSFQNFIVPGRPVVWTYQEAW